MRPLPTWIDEVTSTDVVVIGSGAAGLRLAHGLASRRVDLLTLGTLGTSGASARAQGGIAAPVDPNDSARLHARDTLETAHGLGCSETVELLIGRADREIERLLSLGMRFDRSESGALALGREAAHSRDRILHADGDATGAELMRTLGTAVQSSPHVRVSEATRAFELVYEQDRVVGVLARHHGRRIVLYLGRAVVLATGGIGGLYQRTTNPSESRGNGISMAARVGARLSDLEFVQFHPTALAVWANPVPLVSEALRGAGATLISENGEPIMAAEHPLGDLAPRDIVARAVWRRQQQGERVLLDARAVFASKGPDAFPTISRLCDPFGLDPARQPIPISPAAHYHMGGVWADESSRTTVSGLWACGEVACTGVHGANRLASNSLLEALVFGGLAAEDIDRTLARQAGKWSCLAHVDWESIEGRNQIDADHGLMVELRRRMWQGMGVIREHQGLTETLSWIGRALEAPQVSDEMRSALLVAFLMTISALARKESRGSHYRADYPETRSEWKGSQSVWVSGAATGSPQIEIRREGIPPQTGVAEGSIS
jgi:L-aspartate oxidase